ncbi:MAG: B12-binding domain-containing radical SAM protein [candidate division KSB1 bacterium]|nr:B12-binding domain-containing radical SAM protein [candidate division KSB1 bacterium]
MSTATQPKIIFIEPKSPNLHIYSKFVIPRLGILILGTIMKQLGWDVQVILEESEELDFDSIEAADMVGISTITSTAPRAYTIADQVRTLGIPVIMGGPHVSYLPDEALQHADFVFRGEAEEALPLFIRQWLTSQDYGSVPNLSFQQNGKVFHNPLGQPIQNLDIIPYPDLSLVHSGIKRTFGYRIIPIQTSRGCPFDCEFCSVTGMFGRKLRYRSTENIIQELRQYDDKKNAVFFYDDNFTANPRRAKELLRAMIAEKFKFSWSTQVRADVAKDLELVQLMRQAGCETVYIGFESVDPESLKAMKKNQTAEEIKTAIKVLTKNNIQIHGMFVFGFDTDTPATIQETIRFANRSDIGTVQFLILTPLPGSETFRKLKEEGRIKFFDWTLYDAHHAVFDARHLSIDELQRAQIKGHQSFYSLKLLLKRAIHFRWYQVLVGFYARRLNRIWKKRNRLWLKVLELLKPNFDFQISIDFKQVVRLPKKFYDKKVDKIKRTDRRKNYVMPGLNESSGMAISK